MLKPFQECYLVKHMREVSQRRYKKDVCLTDFALFYISHGHETQSNLNALVKQNVLIHLSCKNATVKIILLLCVQKII